jgi:ferredoxin
MPRIEVDLVACDSHGQCEIAAPDLFQLVGPKDVRYPSEITADQLADAWAAADACPMQVIKIIE